MTRVACRNTKPLVGGYVGINVLGLVAIVLLRDDAAVVDFAGTFSLRMKIERSVCGLILTGIVVIVSGKHLRSLSAARGLTAGPGSLPDR